MHIPPEILHSPLYAAGGYTVIPNLLPAGLLAALEADARSAHPSGQRNVLALSAADEDRGGSPARAFTSAPSGPIQWQTYSAAALVANLRQITGLPVEPTGAGSYTFYEQPGDYLALHRDIVTCDLALITCLSETPTQPADESGVLLAYPDHIAQPLSSARQAGRHHSTPVPLPPGDTVLLFGGIVPHEVTPMNRAQQRIVSVMCYRILVRA